MRRIERGFGSRPDQAENLNEWGNQAKGEKYDREVRKEKKENEEKDRKDKEEKENRKKRRENGQNRDSRDRSTTAMGKTGVRRKMLVGRRAACKTSLS